MTTGEDAVGAPETAPAATGAPDVKSATAQVRDKRTGRQRPRKSNAGRPRKAATNGAAAEPETPASEPPTPEEIEGAAVLGGTVWGLAAPMFGYRLLTPEESQKFGAALAPVLKKYLPALAAWQLEINLAVTVYMLAQATRPRPSTSGSFAEPDPPDGDAVPGE